MDKQISQDLFADDQQLQIDNMSADFMQHQNSQQIHFMGISQPEEEKTANCQNLFDILSLSESHPESRLIQQSPFQPRKRLINFGQVQHNNTFQANCLWDYFEHNEIVHELLQNEDEIKSSIFSQSKEQSNKSVKGKHYAKNYRQKKKEEIKQLQEENRFLKQKVEDLSFRLKETEVELNKFKHSTQMMNNSPTFQNYQTTRQFYMKQIQQLLINPDVQLQKLIQTQKNLRMLNTFSNKHRMDMLNYFMSELLQNLINDVTFYYLDSIIEKKGFWRSDETIPFRKMDEEILAFYDNDDVEYYHKSMQNVIGPMTTLMKNFKSMWKKLYQDYLNIIQQGSMLQSLYMPYAQKFLQQNTRKQVIYSLKLQLYFEKIKYRKDMRQLRESWFKQFQKEEQQSKMNKYRAGKKFSGQNK